ncbi:MAG: MCE family protein [Gemmatimonadetes bacterium]|nr:MCE family protein [Gemmatimonadota bacterium]MBT8404524.1 MCE family protein [Gemmatimonadota bacterium]NNF37054.1 MCE family protein [Gemmatimonadota bacterium]NNK62811.1 MCE family protein [Gemmatimonadota bacterium]
MTDPQSGPSDRELARTVPRDTGARHIRVGIFVIFGIVSFFTVLFLMTDPAGFRGRYNLVTELTDAGGVRRGDPIQMRGVIIGRVSGFEMTPAGRVALTLELYDDWRIPVGSTATLAEAGVFGGRTVEVMPGDGTTVLTEGDTIPGDDAGGGIFETVENLGVEAETVLERLEMLLDTATVRSVQGSTREVEGLARDLRSVVAEQKDEIGRLTSTLARAAEGLERTADDAGPELASAAARADSLLASMEETTAQLDGVLATLDTVLGRMARGEGTLGRLSQDESLFVNTNTALENLNALLVDLRENPGRYLTIEIF